MQNKQVLGILNCFMLQISHGASKVVCNLLQNH
jgi:hypothetical protein